MASPNVTIIMSPREQFSLTQRAIESIYNDAAAVPFDLVCIDGGSPPPVRDYLRAESQRRGFRLVRTPYYLGATEAHNLALDEIGEIKTRYTVFIDNDVVCAPGWLKHLVECAEETGAAIVSPVICIGEPLHTKVHVGGGDLTIVVEDGKRVFRETLRFYERPLAEVRDQLVRAPVGTAEFHCLLIRTEWLERLGRFDDGLKSIYEHVDLCMTVLGEGGVIMLEPHAIVTEVFGPPLALNEVGFYFFRWNEQWARDSEHYFQAKWQADPSQNRLEEFVKWRRRHALPGLRRALQFFVGWRLSEWMFDRMADIYVWLAMRRRPATLRQGAQLPLPRVEESAEKQRRAA